MFASGGAVLRKESGRSLRSAADALGEKSRIFALLDSQSGGFAAWLKKRRDEKRSFHQISIEINDEFGVIVNPATVGRWLSDLGLVEKKATAPQKRGRT